MQGVLRGLAVITSLSATAAFGAPKKIVVVSSPKQHPAETTILEQAVLSVLRGEPDTLPFRLQKAGKAEARAEREAEQARALLASAKANFESLELEAAIKDYSKAAQKLDNGMPLTNQIDALQHALSMLAASQLLLGQEKKARQVIERLVALDGSYVPDQSIYNPQMLAVFDEVAGEVSFREKKSLTVTTQPEGAAIIVDGKLAGVSPVTLSALPPGRHYVQAQLAGFESAGKAVEVKKAQDLKLKLGKAKPVKELQGLADASVAAIDGSEVPLDALELAQLVNAAEVVIISTDGKSHKLARFAANASSKDTKTVSGSLADALGAVSAASTLLGVGAGTAVATATPASQKVDMGASSGSGGSGSSSSSSSSGGGGSGASSGGGKSQGEKDTEEIIASNQSGSGGGGAASGSSSGGSGSGGSGGSGSGGSSTAASGGGGTASDGGSSSKGTVLLATYGTAGALASASAVFGFLALSSQKSFNQVTRNGTGGIDHLKTTDQIEGETVSASGKKRAFIADVLLAGAVVAGVIGLTLQVAWNPDPEPATRTSTSAAAPTAPSADGWALTVTPVGATLQF